MKSLGNCVAALIMTAMVWNLGTIGARGQVVVSREEPPAFNELDVAIREPLRGILTAIPEDTESFLFVRGPFREAHQPNERVIFDPSRPEESLRKMPFDDLQQVELQSRHLSEAVAIDQQRAFRTMPLHFISFAARRMEMPTQIPAVGPLQFLEVAHFEQPVPAIDDWFERVNKSSTAFGVDVWVQQRAGQPVLHLAKLSDSAIACSNHEGYLRSYLARRLHQEQVQRVAFPATLREWSFLDVRSPVWGLRHYREDTRETSVTNLQRVDANLAGATIQCIDVRELQLSLASISASAPVKSDDAWAHLQTHCGLSNLRVDATNRAEARIGIAESWKQDATKSLPSDLHFGLLALLGIHVAL